MDVDTRICGYVLRVEFPEKPFPLEEIICPGCYKRGETFHHILRHADAKFVKYSGLECDECGKQIYPVH